MNKSIKITLLLLAIIGAVGGVMAYYRTIVSPPGKLAFKNQYIISNKEDIAKVKASTTDASIDSIYVAVTHELDFQLSNKNLTNQERDELLESFVTQYVPVFVSSCNSKFSQSYWDESNLKHINNKIAELRDLVSTDRKVIIQGEMQTSLNNIHNVIINYYEAKRVASANGYNGIQSAKQRIAEAKRYVTMSPLNNCSDLMNRLNSEPSRLEQAHYAYLANQVERLRAYYNYSNQSDYDNVALDVSEKIDEYKKNAKSTYGRISDISTLEGRAGSYYSNAKFD